MIPYLLIALATLVDYIILKWIGDKFFKEE